MKFLKSKYIPRLLAFFFLMTPMLLLQLHEDRTVMDLALRDRDSNQCYAIKRNFIKANCFSKIATRKEVYCKLMPKDSWEECIQKEVTPLHQEALNTPRIRSSFLLLLELIFISSLSIWIMGLSPQKLVLRYLPKLQELSLSQNFIIVRVGIGLVSLILFHITWNKILEL